MSESKTKTIERNRAPRVHISYDVETYGSPTTVELPFVMGVTADLAGESESRAAKLSVTDREFVDLNAGGFSKYMKDLAPRVTARVRDTLPAEGDEGAEAEERARFVDLTFESMSDFTPVRVAEQVPELAELLEMRARLVELLGYMGGRQNAEKRIAQLLSNEPLLQKMATEALAAGGAEKVD
ncbi:MAG TPA: type VI secretion system contractile sheath small subunit [Thermohalobaculum sp.]|nr:type VI secretion system contractile sheath small subunit [Thermohalobaculum sp.]